MNATPSPPKTASTAILLVEDEPTLRMALARGLSRLDNVEVMAAGTVDEAVSLLATCEPSILISDIDLPGPSGLDLVAELGRRDIDVPIILVTAYLKTYRSQIPSRPDVLVLEKPIPLEDLRGRVRALLRTSDGEPQAPFTVIDRIAGSQPVHGADEETRARTHTLPGIPQVRPENLRPCVAAPSFDELWARGVEALLQREYAVAARAFAAAGEIRQGHPGVVANLRRLKEMGYFQAGQTEPN